LTAAEVAATLLDARLVAALPLFDDVVDGRVSCRLADALRGNRRVPHRHVFGHRSAEQEDFLVDDRQRVRDQIPWNLVAGHAVEEHVAAPWLIETRNQLGRRRLAAAARPDE